MGNYTVRRPKTLTKAVIWRVEFTIPAVRTDKSVRGIGLRQKPRDSCEAYCSAWRLPPAHTPQAPKRYSSAKKDGRPCSKTIAWTVRKAARTSCYLKSNKAALTLNAALPQFPCLPQPAKALGHTGTMHRRQFADAFELNAAIAQYRVAHLRVPRPVPNPAVIPIRRVHGDRDLRRAAR